MGRVHLSARQQYERKQHIARSAIPLFAGDNGFSKTWMHDIAKDAGISVGNLYRSFKDKEDILLFICEEGWREINEQITAAVAKQPDPRTKILALIACWGSFFYPRQELACILRRETYSSQEERLRSHEKEAGHLKLETCIQ